MKMADTALVVQAHWTRLRPLILKAIPLMGGTYDEPSLLRAVLGGRMTFWPGEKCFYLAAIDEFPCKKRLNILLANGDESELARVGERVEAWGKAAGATEVYEEVRPGIDRQAVNGKRDTHGLKRSRVIWTRAI